MGEIIIRYIPLPCTIQGYTATDANNDYNIYINSNIGYAAQEKAKAHELAHIKNGHLFSEQSAAVCESEV